MRSVFGTVPPSVIKINEVFHSIQGESSWVGWPTVFVRLSGCNLRCRYCDSTYAFYDGHLVSVDDLIGQIQVFPAKHICITGGEPLLQKDVHTLMRRLCDFGYQVSLETSGSIDCKDVDVRVKKVIDVKTPDSGAADSFNPRNLPGQPGFSIVNTEYKFVLCSETDFDWAIQFCEQHKLAGTCEILMSPAYQRVNPKWLAEKILSQDTQVRLQTQLHKFMWSPHARGI